LPPECHEANTIPSLKPFKKIQRVREVEDCQKLCQESAICDYYKWKVGHNSNVASM
jgi:hypothetical protein